MAIDSRSLMQSAIAAHQAGRLLECERLCQRIVQQSPKSVEAMLLSGIVAAKMGRAADAILRLRQVIRWEPNSFPALNWLAMLLRENGSIIEATAFAEKAVAAKPDESDALSNLALCYLSQGRHSEAVASFERAIALRPNQAQYRQGLASAFEQAGLNREAIKALEAACELSPDPAWFVKLGNLYLSEGMLDAAIKASQRVLSIDPDIALAYLVLSLAHEGLGRHVEAEGLFEKSIRHPGNTAEFYKIRALRRQSEGRFNESAADFKKSLELVPAQGLPYYGIVSTQSREHADQQLVDEMESKLASTKLDSNEIVYIHFALGKALDGLGDYSGAMRHFDRANRLLKETKLGNRPFDRARFSRRIDKTIEIFSKDLLDEVAAAANLSDLPLFVVGMMRSGTTLLEQILTCHELIGGVGEQGFWMHALPGLIDFESGRIEIESTLGAGTRYVELLRQLDSGHRHIIDKNPANFFALGAIRMALPMAKIIHVRRNPIDTCLSIFMTPINNPPEFACDPSNIVYAYREYLRLMEHWRSVIPPSALLDMDYEALIDQPEETTRQLVGFCGVTWDERCLRPEANVKSVRTPSFWQVRQPLYRTSVDRWQRYQAVLGPFAELAQ